jgi:hypothetical protein
MADSGLTQGCLVEVTTAPPGRPRLLGKRGKGVVPPEHLAWGLCSVELEKPLGGQQTWLLSTRYLTRLRPPRPRRRRSIWDA